MSVLNRSAKLILFHRSRNPADNGENKSRPYGPVRNLLLQTAVCNEFLVGAPLTPTEGRTCSIKKHIIPQRNCRCKNSLVAVPDDWPRQADNSRFETVFYQKDLSLPEGTIRRWRKSRRLMVSNGRFAAEVNHNQLSELLHNLRADVVAVNVAPELRAGCDKVLISRSSRIVGFCRYYEDAIHQAPCNDWPHLLFINTDSLDAFVASNIFCLSFSSLAEKIHSGSLNFRSIRVAGGLLDLNSREGLLDYLETRVDTGAILSHGQPGLESNSLNRDGVKIDRSARLTGKVLLGRNVTIESNVIITGPAIIGDNVTIARDALIRASIIVSGARIEREQIVDGVVVTGEAADLYDERTKSIPASVASDKPVNLISDLRSGGSARSSRYRVWPRFSYAGCFKRLADILAAIIVLILFAPVLPVIALIVKLTSPGPVLFKDKRQGLHGKTFDCMKFRTMIVGADKIQRKLRVVSQVDGPQFKMENDPRVSRVGQFLRDTYIDEIPQFVNVLLGQMSVVGPRPSPEAENTMCAYWRDARLSVRPGLTGLWQIHRTRQAMKDFQEWIHYDTEYVRSISVKVDMQICWETFKKMVMNFARRF